jgi:hypothetical protein
MNYEPPVFVQELKALLGISHSNTIRLKIKNKKIPPPDVCLSQKNRYWHRETLRLAGLIPKSQGMEDTP